MHELKPQQTVLVAVLAAFVVSIATTVITITLTTEPELPLHQTFNQVVERTVERVVEVPEAQSAQTTSAVLGEQTENKIDVEIPEPYDWAELILGLQERVVSVYALGSDEILRQGVALDDQGQVVALAPQSADLRLQASFEPQSESQAVVRSLFGVTLLQVDQAFAAPEPRTKLFTGEEIIVRNDSSAGFAVFVIGEHDEAIGAYQTTACHADSIGAVAMDSRGDLAGICGTQNDEYYLYPLSRFATMQPALSANPELVFSHKP